MASRYKSKSSEARWNTKGWPIEIEVACGGLYSTTKKEKKTGFFFQVVYVFFCFGCVTRVSVCKWIFQPGLCVYRFIQSPPLPPFGVLGFSSSLCCSD
ncbi:hypothetical protein L1887_04225 [Cichorium endivia]|nr:hypothetical protein L1887_04225 [Cichorium endivia]